MILVRGVIVLHVGGGGDDTAVLGGRGDGTGVHERNARKLTLAGLRALAVGEVSGGVAQREAVVGRYVACTEAGAAEGGLDHRTCFQQLGGHADAGQLQRYGHRGGIDRQGEIAVSGVTTAQDGVCLVDGVKHTARTARDYALVSQHRAIGPDLVHQLEVSLLEGLGGLLFNVCKDLLCVGDEIVDGVDVGGVEGEGDHGFHGREINVDHGVVVSAVLGSQLCVVLGATVGLVVLAGDLVGDPDRGETGGLGGHDVDAVAEVDGKTCNAGTYELQNLVLDESAGEGRAHQRQRHVVRADAALGGAVQIDHDHLWAVDVVSILQELLDQLGTALTDTHGA